MNQMDAGNAYLRKNASTAGEKKENRGAVNRKVITSPQLSIFHQASRLMQACQRSTVKWNTLASFWHRRSNGALLSHWRGKMADIPATRSEFTVMSEAGVRRTGPMLLCAVSPWLHLFILSPEQSLWTSCGGNFLLSLPHIFHVYLFILLLWPLHPWPSLFLSSMYHSDCPNLKPTHAPFLLFISPSSSFSLSLSVSFPACARAYLRKLCGCRGLKDRWWWFECVFPALVRLFRTNPAGVAS